MKRDVKWSAAQGTVSADFYMENVLVVWLTGWAEWREYDEDNKKRLL
ncbi:MAG: hypothetical protein ACLRPZ_14750 [Coprococcus sp.]